MKILIIGGTRFFGRRLVEVSLAAGHEVTVFHRGKHSIASAGRVEEILGDRNTDLDKLDGRYWDAVIDTCGYLPVSVDASVKALTDSAGSYVFISSISAYGDFSQPFFDENTVLARLTEEQEAAVSSIDPKVEMSAPLIGAAYGGAKVVCEEIVQDAFPGRSLIVRPGLIVGEFDHTDRFTYWVMRVAEGGNVLAPGNPDTAVQFIDAKDLAAWTLNAIANKFGGAFSVNGNPGAMTFGEMLGRIKTATCSDAEFTWVSEDFLRENEVEQWSDLPFYMFEDKEMAGFELAGIDKALEHGLELRHFEKTVKELYGWRIKVDRQMRAGLSREREIELLSLWLERKVSPLR